jgi:hypothetical protein
MVIGKQNILIPGGRKKQRSYSGTGGNGNYTDGIQHGPSQIPPNIGVGQENGKFME